MKWNRLAGILKLLAINSGEVLSRHKLPHAANHLWTLGILNAVAIRMVAPGQIVRQSLINFDGVASVAFGS